MATSKVRERVLAAAIEFAAVAHQEAQADVNYRNEHYQLDIPQSLLKTPLPNSIVVWVTTSNEVVAITAGLFTSDPLHLSFGLRVGKIVGQNRTWLLRTGNENSRFQRTIQTASGRKSFRFYEVTRISSTQYAIKSTF